jgi:hypothetical protein
VIPNVLCTSESSMEICSTPKGYDFLGSGCGLDVGMLKR